MLVTPIPSHTLSLHVQAKDAVWGRGGVEVLIIAARGTRPKLRRSQNIKLEKDHIHVHPSILNCIVLHHIGTVPYGPLSYCTFHDLVILFLAEIVLLCNG